MKYRDRRTWIFETVAIGKHHEKLVARRVGIPQQQLDRMRLKKTKSQLFREKNEKSGIELYYSEACEALRKKHYIKFREKVHCFFSVKKLHLLTSDELVTHKKLLKKLIQHCRKILLKDENPIVNKLFQAMLLHQKELKEMEKRRKAQLQKAQRTQRAIRKQEALDRRRKVQQQLKLLNMSNDALAEARLQILKAHDELDLLSGANLVEAGWSLHPRKLNAQFLHHRSNENLMLINSET